MRGKKKLKAPFVVTVAVAAATLGACGGKTNATATATEAPEWRECLGKRCSVECGYSPRLRCVDGTWVEAGVYNPPSQQGGCPLVEPRVSGFCAAVRAACSYRNRCADRSSGAPENRTYTCTDDTWQRDSSKAVCPKTMPQPGSSCAACAGDYPAACTYPQSGGCPPSLARCDTTTETWMFDTPTCEAMDGGADGGP